MKTIINIKIDKEAYFGIVLNISSGLEKLLGRVEKDITNKKNLSSRFSSKKEINKHLS